MKYQSIDEIERDTQGLLLYNQNKQGPGCNELSSPIIFELADPMARFPCLAEDRKFVAESAAESLYMLSGMNSNDFIWEFRGLEDPNKSGYSDYPAEVKPYNKHNFGSHLRFQGKNKFILDYQRTNALRQNGPMDYIDQLAVAIDILKKSKENGSVVIQFAALLEPLVVHSAWLHVENGKLEMLVSAGKIDNFYELPCKIVSPFAFLHQIISELSDVPMGSSRFMIGCLYTSVLTHPRFLRFINSPIINTHGFRYPYGNLSLRDVDTVMSIMLEFVARLDENSLVRANPFEGDDRVQMWSDYAEVFRAWKAEKLGYKIQMEQNFYHPQLRFIYKGETV